MICQWEGLIHKKYIRGISYTGQGCTQTVDGSMGSGTLLFRVKKELEQNPCKKIEKGPGFRIV